MSVLDGLVTKFKPLPATPPSRAAVAQPTSEDQPKTMDPSAQPKPPTQRSSEQEDTKDNGGEAQVLHVCMIKVSRADVEKGTTVEAGASVLATGHDRIIYVYNAKKEMIFTSVMSTHDAIGKIKVLDDRKLTITDDDGRPWTAMFRNSSKCSAFLFNVVMSACYRHPVPSDLFASPIAVSISPGNSATVCAKGDIVTVSCTAFICDNQLKNLASYQDSKELSAEFEFEQSVKILGFSVEGFAQDSRTVVACTGGTLVNVPDSRTVKLTFVRIVSVRTPPPPEPSPAPSGVSASQRRARAHSTFMNVTFNTPRASVDLSNFKIEVPVLAQGESPWNDPALTSVLGAAETNTEDDEEMVARERKAQRDKERREELEREMEEERGEHEARERKARRDRERQEELQNEEGDEEREEREARERKARRDRERQQELENEEGDEERQEREARERKARRDRELQEELEKEAEEERNFKVTAKPAAVTIAPSVDLSSAKPFAALIGDLNSQDNQEEAPAYDSDADGFSAAILKAQSNDPQKPRRGIGFVLASPSFTPHPPSGAPPVLRTDVWTVTVNGGPAIPELNKLLEGISQLDTMYRQEIKSLCAAITGQDREAASKLAEKYSTKHRIGDLTGVPSEDGLITSRTGVERAANQVNGHVTVLRREIEKRGDGDDLSMERDELKRKADLLASKEQSLLELSEILNKQEADFKDRRKKMKEKEVNLRQRETRAMAPFNPDLYMEGASSGGGASPTPVGGVSKSLPSSPMAAAAIRMRAETLKQGYLTKQGHFFKGMKRRYFIMVREAGDIGCQLYYYRSKGDDKPVGIIAMRGAVAQKDTMRATIGGARSISTRSLLQIGDNSNSFTVTTKDDTHKTFVVKADSPAEMNEWIEMIKSSSAM
eukprot:TRINITY_DN3741_c0_g1_i2.p1 TRINITY_DN3741_c0_g1~~TRINITY_DN3741_c0_g1_i2.p1  ORF type:complete len:892 (-),score=165.07 TRINITY_DN3741_c0_g1_i2:30-2705(-)